MPIDPASGAVKSFVQGVRSLLRSGTIEGRASLVELIDAEIPRLSETYFKERAWPSAKEVSDWLDKDTLVALLYKELTQRHELERAFSPATAAAQFDTYIMLFDLFLGRSESASDEWAAWTVQLPFAWMWQLVSGFSSLCVQVWHAADLLLDESAQARKALTDRPQMLSPQVYLAYLEALAVRGALAKGMRCTPSGQALHTGAVPMAFFALLGQVRIHLAAGDFESASETLELLNSHRHLHTPFASVTDARAALSHAKALVLLLGQRRPNDALRFTQTNLRHLLKADDRKDKDAQPQKDSVHKLLALAAVLPYLSGKPSQQRDGFVMRRVRDHFHAQTKAMQAGNLDAFVAVFRVANVTIPPVEVAMDAKNPSKALKTLMEHTDRREAEFRELAALAQICARVGTAVAQYDSLALPKFQSKLAALHAKQQLLQARLNQGGKKAGLPEEVKTAVKTARDAGVVDSTHDLESLLTAICDDVDGFVSAALERTFAHDADYLVCHECPPSSVRSLQGLIVSMNRFDGIIKQLQRV
ncbi:MAG: hypothetical protein MHM6MM_002302 [Cercozoa sp. M6MM]